MIDYYAVLELSPSASYHQIRSAYRRLAFRYHPDVSTVSVDIAQMQLLNEAYAILGSPVKRAQYDFLRSYTDQPTSFHPTRSEPRSSSTAYSVKPSNRLVCRSKAVGLLRSSRYSKRLGAQYYALWW